MEVAAGKLLLEVVTPEDLILSEEVDEVTAEGVEGDFGVLPGHINFLTALRPGALAYRIGTSTTRIEIRGGIAEVLDNCVTILAASRA
ncbi:MAG: ATP synthase F1 subunit epsilon [Nitrospirae bacterium]|nr:ATP synthase F1 subunit epsilon [Nitrospirota bacterium]